MAEFACGNFKSQKNVRNLKAKYFFILLSRTARIFIMILIDRNVELFWY